MMYCSQFYTLYINFHKLEKTYLSFCLISLCILTSGCILFIANATISLFFMAEQYFIVHMCYFNAKQTQIIQAFYCSIVIVIMQQFLFCIWCNRKPWCKKPCDLYIYMLNTCYSAVMLLERGIILHIYNRVGYQNLNPFTLVLVLFFKFALFILKIAVVFFCSYCLDINGLN